MAKEIKTKEDYLEFLEVCAMMTGKAEAPGRHGSTLIVEVKSDGSTVYIIKTVSGNRRSIARNWMSALLLPYEPETLNF